MKKVMTGMKPTGEMLHVGNLLGALLPMKEYMESNHATLMVADLHALTSVKDGEKMSQQTREIAINYLSVLGLDAKVDIFIQSHMHQITKLMWILCNFTPHALMLRAHSFKDAQNKGEDISMGVFNYPILMAADIIGYGFEEIPVGKDQKQHLEMARDIARYFNKTYNREVFIEPVEKIQPDVMTIPGLDGRKMSKSYNNFIGLFETDKQLKKKVMSIPTDSLELEDKKDPETCNVFTLIKLFANPKEIEDIAAKYRAGGYGYGHAKLALLEILIRYLTPYRENRAKLIADPSILDKKLEEGAQKMNARLDEVMERVSACVGL